MRRRYPSDLTDQQWAMIEPLIPVHKVGRPREVDMREVLNTILYLNRSGGQWDMPPHDLLPNSTVYDHFAQWRDDGTWQQILDALRHKIRAAAGCEPSPSAGSVERTFAWLGRCRKNSRDYERQTHSNEAMLKVSSIHRMLRLLSPDSSSKPIPFKCRET